MKRNLHDCSAHLAAEVARADLAIGTSQRSSRAVYPGVFPVGVFYQRIEIEFVCHHRREAGLINRRTTGVRNEANASARRAIKGIGMVTEKDIAIISLSVFLAHECSHARWTANGITRII